MTQPTPETATPGAPLFRILWHAPWLWMALVAVFFCLPLFLALDRTDVENDEAGYTYGVEKMLATGDWLTPRGIYDGESPFLEKPPLKFWIVALPIRLGLLPASPFGFRFWDALMGSVAFLYVFAIGRRLAGPVCGFAAVLLLFTYAPLIFHHGLRTNNMEAPLLLQYAGTMYHFMAWRSGARPGRGHLMGIALYFVLGFMTKFVAAVFAPLVILLAVAVSSEDRRRLWRHRLDVLTAAALAAVLILPWFIYQYRAVGRTLFEQMFGDHVVKRFTVFIDPKHVEPWHFYFTQMWLQLQPASRALVIAGAVLLLLHVLRRRWMDGAIVLLWFAVPVGLISTGTSKLHHYLYPFLPPVALAGGYAAAALAAWIWRAIARPVDTFVRRRDAWLPAAAGVRRAQAVLTFAGVAAGLVALATYLTGALRLTLGPVLLRNSGVARPIVVGVAVILAGASATTLRAILAVVLVLAPLPLQAYRTTLERIATHDRPMTNLQTCLTAVVKDEVAAGRTPPGVWVEASAFGHMFFYYLRHLGPWQARSVASNATVAMHVLAPPTHRPVLLSHQRFSDFSAAVGTPDSTALVSAAKRAPMDLETLLERSRTDTIGVVDFADVILLLPGQYAKCGTRVLPPLVPGK